MGGSRLRNFLVAAEQVAVSVLLLATAGLLSPAVCFERGPRSPSLKRAASSPSPPTSPIWEAILPGHRPPATFGG